MPAAATLDLIAGHEAGSRRVWSTRDHSPKVTRVHRLGHMPIESRLVRTAPVLFTPKPCQRDQKHPLQCTDSTQAPRHFVAVHSGHANVQEDNRRHECCGNFQSRRPIMHHLHIVTPDPVAGIAGRDRSELRADGPEIVHLIVMSRSVQSSRRWMPSRSGRDQCDDTWSFTRLA